MKSLAHKSRHQRCALCGRQAETGTRTDLGWAGPECQRKVAALPDLFKKLGLKNYGTVVQVPTHRWDGITEYGFPYSQLKQRLSTAGLTLQRVGGIDWTAEQPVATFTVRVDRVRKFNAAIKPYSQVQREFADRLKAGSAARLAEVN